MPTDIVLDSTAIAAIFFRDPYSERVEAALKKFEGLHTLDLAFAEVGNVAWKRVRFFNEEYVLSSKALASSKNFIQNVCRVTESSDLVTRALEIGINEEITVYDALFVTLAMDKKLKLLTTDEKLHGKLQASKKLGTLSLLP